MTGIASRALERATSCRGTGSGPWPQFGRAPGGRGVANLESHPRSTPRPLPGAVRSRLGQRRWAPVSPPLSGAEDAVVPRCGALPPSAALINRGRTRRRTRRRSLLLSLPLAARENSRDHHGRVLVAFVECLEPPSARRHENACLASRPGDRAHGDKRPPRPPLRWAHVNAPAQGALGPQRDVWT